MTACRVTRLRHGVTRKANAGAESYAVTQLRASPIHMRVHVCACVCVRVCVRDACVTA